MNHYFPDGYLVGGVVCFFSLLINYVLWKNVQVAMVTAFCTFYTFNPIILIMTADQDSLSQCTLIKCSFCK